MSNICVTGGMGFIGSHLALALQARGGNEITVIDDLSGGTRDNLLGADPPAQVIHNGFDGEDCSNRERMLEIFRAEKIDTLVHCAANARESASQFQPHIVTRRNLDAYASTLSAAIEAGVKNVMCFSSIAIYGHQKPPFTEDMPPMPQDVYAINKTAMEQLTRVLSQVHGFNYVIVRPYNVFGERQRLNDRYRNVIGIWMNQIMRCEPIAIFGDGKQRRAFTYIGDILPALCSLVANIKRFHGETYNIGGFEDIELIDLANRVCRSMGDPRHKIVHVEDRPQEVKYAYSSPEKAVKELALSVKLGIDHGLGVMAAWASGKGPQEWVNNDPMEINSELLPSTWK